MTTTTELRSAPTPASRLPDEDAAPRRTAPEPRRTAAWRTWDWANLALGLFLVAAPLLIPGAPTARFLILGLLVSAIALWALATASSYASEITMSITAFVTYFSGHLGFFAAVPRWTLWLTGLAVFAVAMYALKERQVRG